MKKNILTIAVLTLLVVSGNLSAQISPIISVQGTNATLRWASTSGETYVVLYRRAFHDAFPWVVLNASVQASGGIETFYQHAGGVPKVPASVGGGSGGGGSPGSPSAATLAAPSGGADAKTKKKDIEFPSFPALPDEKALEKWLKDLLKEREKHQNQVGGNQPMIALMASSLTAEEATNTSMGFYVVLNALDDLNGDGVPDGVAAQHGVNPLNDVTQTDSDGDGLTDEQEIISGTNPNKTDTDGDGASDAEEFNAGSDPLTPHGLPGVSLLFYEEFVNQPNDGINGGHHSLYQQQWGVRVIESNRWVYATPVDGQVGHTDFTEWPMQFAQIRDGTTTSWRDMVGGGKADISVTTNVSTIYRIRPSDGLMRNGTIDGTRYTSTPQMTTLGVSTNLQRTYLITLTAYTNGGALSSYVGVTIKGKPLDALGRVLLTLPDNTRQTITPIFPAGLSHAAFTTPSIQVLDMDVVHPVTGEMSEADEAKRGGLVAVRRDFNSPVTVLRLRGQPELGGSTYKLDWTSPNIRIWQDANRTLPVINGGTSFPADQETDVYLEGLTRSTAEKDVVVTSRVTIGGVQSIAQQVPLTVVDAEFTAILRIFIPYDWVKFVGLGDLRPFQPNFNEIVAKGDNRSFAPDLSGTHRIRQTSIITPFPDLSPSAFKIVQGTPENYDHLGETRHYKWATSLSAAAGFTAATLPIHSGNQVGGGPGYLTTAAKADNDVSLVGGDYLKAIGTATNGGMHFDSVARSNAETTVRLHGNASEPILTLLGILNYAAAIDWDFYITVNVANPVVPNVRLKGKQDGFPAYEIYMQRVQGAPVSHTTTVYQWQPLPDKDVTSLFPIRHDQPVSELPKAIK